ncbi:ADP-ribose pyrophosphatase YjhB, NUDIX family [Anaerobranca californiensis DSM 14826]|jgi:ADP-ribose pyrophosphatase YjhB (NUDIX family)|uniref:ADP-ribose pyrophosphatase YjhB, NUDIX family n=1 Tax=Anaerobranca californiensis DSM 14826 TaxID=1120989 RepID=A0A1M6NUX6_9FIRM|nr:NUDIX domain-containing protein [Anaerobranca californiensis]SHJ99523.1 ADP-ribose pyrophosphatase YjhB, NUDIX family [Anaerobranca californiensis DSM 14826]
MFKHFTVAVFVVHQNKVLLLKHKKLKMWLPPGGHIEDNEIPDEAAVREVKEETGLDVILVGEKGLDIDYPQQLILPKGIQLENIKNEHQHVDLVYFAKVKGNANFVLNEESEQMGWYSIEDLPPDVNTEIRLWCIKAIKELGDIQK